MSCQSMHPLSIRGPSLQRMRPAELCSVLLLLGEPLSQACLGLRACSAVTFPQCFTTSRGNVHDVWHVAVEERQGEDVSLSMSAQFKLRSIIIPGNA